jgi:hypothetical protein
MPTEKLQFESDAWESNVISSIPMDGENNGPGVPEKPRE